MTERDDNYKVGDALEEAHLEYLTSLLGSGTVAIAIHDISRDNFDRIAGEERHFPENAERGEFWAKTGFHWNNERHSVYVNYFTHEKPVVVPLAPRAPEGFAADSNPPYGDDSEPDDDPNDGIEAPVGPLNPEQERALVHESERLRGETP